MAHDCLTGSLLAEGPILAQSAASRDSDCVPTDDSRVAIPASMRTALSGRPLIGLRLDPRLDSRTPISNMTSDPVASRTLTAVTPAIERSYGHPK